MLLMYNYVLLKMSTWYSKHVEESNNIWRINSIQCITLVVLYGQFMMHGQRNIKLSETNTVHFQQITCSDKSRSLVTPSYTLYDNNKNHMFDTKLSPSRCDTTWSGWRLPTSWKKRLTPFLEQMWVACSFKTLVTTNQTAIRQNAGSSKISQRSKFSAPGTGTVHNSVSWEPGISHERKRPSLINQLWKTPMYPFQTSKHTAVKIRTLMIHCPATQYTSSLSCYTVHFLSVHITIF